MTWARPEWMLTVTKHKRESQFTKLDHVSHITPSGISNISTSISCKVRHQCVCRLCRLARDDHQKTMQTVPWHVGHQCHGLILTKLDNPEGVMTCHVPGDQTACCSAQAEFGDSDTNFWASFYSRTVKALARNSLPALSFSAC